jgi:hypothetical protein
MVLRRARSITRGIGRDEPWKSRLFWALKWLRTKRVPFGPKKVDSVTRKIISTLDLYSYVQNVKVLLA